MRQSLFPVSSALVASSLLTFAITPTAGAMPGGSLAGEVWSAVLSPERGRVEIPGYFDLLDRAEALMEAGRYRTVLLSLPDAGATADVTRANRVLAGAQRHLGNYDKATGLLVGDTSAEAGRLRAEILRDRGRPAEAGALLEAHLQKHPDDLHARLLQGQVAEELGDLEAAKVAYGWFVEQRYLEQWASDPDARVFELPADVVAIAAALDRFATLEGEYAKAPSLHDEIFGMFVRVYDVLERGNLDAHAAAARFLAQRSDRGRATEEIQAVLTRNPNHREALRLAGELALARYDFTVANNVTNRLRAVNPQSAVAQELEASSLLKQRQPEKARPVVDQLLERNENDLAALGLMASIHAQRLEAEAMTQVLEKVETLDPDNATAFFAVGEHLAALRQYPRAEAMLRKAVERAPWWTQPRNELGLLLTQSGDEQGAIAVLTEARAGDPFNAQTANYLGLLQELQGYDRVETREFEIVYDESQDPLVAEVLAESLDEMGRDVAEIYGWTPPQKTQIQVFPTHDRFSVRVAGDPYVGTVGACTGPVIAMVSPRDDKETLGSYDWAQVVRHEFTHTITLGRTDNRIPHWMTEGLAVREEQSPVRQEWMELLGEATNKGELFPVGELTWGFVRPEKPTDRSMAYAQSWLVCEYIFEHWGEAVLPAMLDGFRDGKNEAEVFREVLDISLDDFDEAFAQRMAQHVEEWGRTPGQTAEFAAVMQQGEMALEQGEREAAVEQFEAARQIRPLDELPLRRLAGLYLSGPTADEEKALEMLIALHERSTKDNRFAKTAARLLLKRDERAQALAMARDAVQMAPYDESAHQILLETAQALEDEALVQQQRRRLAILDS